MDGYLTHDLLAIGAIGLSTYNTAVTQDQRSSLHFVRPSSLLRSEFYIFLHGRGDQYR